MKIDTKNYAWALILGIYPLVLLHLHSLLRFWRFKFFFNYLDLFPIVVGILSVASLFYFMNKFPNAKKTFLTAFFVAIPFSLFGMLGGGLLGAPGILINGLFPFLIAFFVGFLVARNKKQ